ncbi:hypothetical protein [Haloarcula pellucida]|uniref:DUF7960 domain-containing protein n=1 Tax=Haloarcula pellucida TaxID=1427151 RepID=A0A830GHY9_9EURY|nr:hypothetical protein [Halomicroarcula pellucida]MBX0347221.1 hypothetical protein [Halomicroarcula pellucida]GGN87591.1 hypothetical protein GCM10009030_06420 [Halomicroarcula pellucida]
MYTGKTEKACCLCGNPDTKTRLDLPPRAVPLLKHAEPIAWRDIVGEVSIYFCAADWDTVRDLVLETGMSPLSRCNAARASFDLREDFEALLNDVRDEPDHSDLEAEMLADADGILENPEDPYVEERDVVEARVVQWVFEDTEAEA